MFLKQYLRTHQIHVHGKHEVVCILRIKEFGRDFRRRVNISRGS